MSKLATEMASWVKARMSAEVLSLAGGNRECRAVFCAPPAPMLRAVFDSLAGDGHLLVARTADGTEISYPVVLQVEDVPGDARVARVDQSGLSSFHGLASIRNDPNCGTFLTLVAPGGQASDTHESTRKAFGVASAANEGGAAISIWWNDPFVQEMVDLGLGEGEAVQREQARQLLQRAVVAADAANQHEVGRSGAWEIIERLWELRDTGLSLDARVSLAAGYPPSEDGRIDSERKSAVLSALADRFESQGLEQLKERAGGDTRNLDSFFQHIRRKCNVVTALKRSMPFFYMPEVVDPGLEWWSALTVQRWEALLEEDAASSAGIEISCINAFAAQAKGFAPIVRDTVGLRVSLQLPDEFESVDVRVVREAPSGAAKRMEWNFSVRDMVEFEDDSIPMHKTPVKYVAEVVGLDAGKSTVKVVSLGSWQPGLIVCSRTAAKGKPPKLAPKKPIETTLEMSGVGRHYLDVYARPGVEILSEEAQGVSEDEVVESAKIGRVADDEFGIEVEAGGERYYEFEIKRPEEDKKETFRICLLADESTVDECNSYFEYHLARNSRRGGGRSVRADSQSRSSQLQGWMLDGERVARSYYPFVLAPDYASQWRRREWLSPEDTIFSAARFLNDPRPKLEEMQPPNSFLAARTLVAEKVRGKDGNDLVESANLGELLAMDKDFESAVDSYIRSYLDWLSSSPLEACWCDIGLVMGLESDNATLEQVPNAIVVSPLHPIRFAWQCLAQRAMYFASRKRPCPAASIMDPDCVPDTIVLPLRDATGGTEDVVYFSVECNSDYWGILWNTNRLDRLSKSGASAPLDREMGLLVGGISSGFSESQVHRALDDVCEMLVAKPVIGVLVSSAAGQNNACNRGILSWGMRHFSGDAGERRNVLAIGAGEVHVFDERGEDVRPDDAEISNLAEDTSNAVQWYSARESGDSHDLAIIAQLETSNASARPTKLSSPLGVGGLVRTRIREQQQAGGGQFLVESRVSGPPGISGDGIADNTAKAISLLEGQASGRMGYVFAPSINAVKKSLDKAEFVAVSSSAVDPACFLGNWLEGTYLWDYELPSYSGRSGDSNGYYLLSSIDDLDIDTMQAVLKRLPDCGSLSQVELSAIVQEVARRGIPTVRGLSAGNSGATGDLGLFVATRLLQDSFRTSGDSGGLLPPWIEKDGEHQIALVIPVDPFQRYLDDLSKAINKPTLHRPDLIVVGLVVSDSSVKCKLTPIEVKNRSGDAQMTSAQRQEALEQAKSLSALLQALQQTFTDEPEMLLWKLAYQNLVSSMVGYGFRVYSQHLAESGRAAEWSGLHSKVMEAILTSGISLDVDGSGRLVVIDGSTTSGPRDVDNDGFKETIELSQPDASVIVRGKTDAFYQSMKASLGNWGLLPSAVPQKTALTESVPEPAPPIAAPSIESVPEEVKVPEGTALIAEKAAPELVGEAHEVGGPSNEGAGPNGQDSPAASNVPVAGMSDGSDQTGLDLRIGDTMDGFQSHVRRLNLGHTALNQMNMGVVGDLGTGKTQLLKSLVFQIANGESGNRGIKPNVLIFDYKKDYSSDDFVQATGARVIRPQHLPLNLFDLSASSQAVNPWLERYRFFADVLDKIYSGIGAVQREKLKTAIKDAYKACGDGAYPTIYDVHRNYVASMKGGADTVTSILGDIVDMELFAEEPGQIQRPDEFLKGVVVIALNDLGQDDRTKNMLVAIMLNVFYERMLKIQKRPFLGKNGDMRVVDSMLLVDEADNIMQYEFEVLRKVLLQGREFGVGVILASQYLSHFKAGATDYKEMLLSWFLHKVPNVSAKDLAPLGLNDASALQQTAERIKTLGLHECLYKTHDVLGEFVKGAPFWRRAEWG
ncbi:type IV secretory system conjugative DNA transfer family protein [Pseudoxanthomonas mexicana]|uniref:type IV secretory system conjugative DNA transfer family protein n=1 Tax=Pseudoxanthomonas mexicana TaxID=128785 RepID=UPI001FD698A3|nr:type IV secretory system conjugative DNA transfer family protein [Pseudoxanthomonas mexicana]UOV04135.1 type IV secretory system conjugative DNA transfer family protein [Pseudoxanthomonas mexicana]